MIDPGTAAQWCGVIVTLLLSIYAIRAARQKDNRTEIDLIKGELGTRAGKGAVEGLDHRLRNIEDDITMIKSELAHLPNKDQTQRLELSIAELKGDIATLTASMQPLAAISNRLQEYLFDQARMGQQK